MKYLLLIFTFFALFFTACSDSTDSSSNDKGDDITLSYAQSITCEATSSFSITPSANNKPNITFSKNTSTGVTTITYNSLDGTATVSGCE